MRKIIWIILSIILITVALFYIFKDTKESDVIVKKIEFINNSIDSITVIQDSIQEKIDTVYVKLETNKIQYEKDIDIIVNNNINEDYCFFREYIDANKSRLDSICNSF